MSELLGLYAGFWILVVIVVIVWILLPFAIFGTKPLLQQILQENKEIRTMFRDDFGRSDTHFLCPYCQEPVKNRAIKCRFCLSEIKAPPPPPEEPKKRFRDYLPGHK